MRIYLIFLILFIFLNCNDSRREDTPAAAKEDSEIVNKEDVRIKEMQNTSKASNKKTYGTNQSQTKYPDWLYIIHAETNKELGQFGDSKISKYVALNDSISYAIVEFNDGVCVKYSLDTYLDRREIDYLEVGVSCDHDLSVPAHEWKEYVLLTSNTIMLKEYREYVDDSLIDTNGYIKDGYDFLEVETKIDSVITLFDILANGKIMKQNKR